MKKFRTLLLLAGSLVITSVASAAPVYWDANGSGGASLGGTGPWDTTSSLWWNGSADAPWNNANNDDAYFTGAAGTVTLQTAISAGDIYFTNVTGNYYITNLTGTEVLSVASAIDTGGGEDTIAALLGNSGTLNKNGNGRLHLPVDNSAGLTGTFMVNQGEVSVENNNSLGNGTSVTVAPGAALELSGGTNNLPQFNNNVTISGSGITNSGALRNVSGVTTMNGAIVLAGDTTLYADSGQLTYLGYQGAPLTANGNYNVTTAGPGVIYNGSMGFNIGTGSITVQGPSTFYNYVTSANAANMVFQNVTIGKGATYEVEDDGDFGTAPGTLTTTNVLIDGGSLISYGSYTMNVNRGITATTNGATLSNGSGTWKTGGIFSSNGDVTFAGAGSMNIASTNFNLGTGRLIKSSTADLNTATVNGGSPAYPLVFSNCVLNAGTYSEAYDTGLGTVPSTFDASNIWFNGGSLHANHSYTMSANRGIYISTGNAIIEETTSGGTLTLVPIISGPGSLTLASGNSNTKIILQANNTYTGGTIVNSAVSAIVGANGSSGTLGAGSLSLAGNLTFNRGGIYVCTNFIFGAGNITNAGSGIVTLTGTNAATGSMILNAGTMLVNNTNASSVVIVNTNATLGGTGIIGGPTTINPGGTLALGSAILSFSNNLTINGNVSVLLNKSSAMTSGQAVVTGTLQSGGAGTILVTNTGPALAPNDTFKLFSQPLAGGATMTVSGGGAVWNNNLANDGTISVQSILPSSKPVINQVLASNGNFIFSGTNGPTTGNYVLLSSTNVTLPFAQWTPVSTNAFQSNGQFSITNPISFGTPQQFFILQVQ